MIISPEISKHLDEIKLPQNESKKGQNGKLLLIGGSDFFHAAGKWSLDTASKLIDMVVYASTPSNNELIKEAKSEFWNGIVIGREDINHFMNDCDTILIGPGMTRATTHSWPELEKQIKAGLTAEQWNTSTELVVNYLLYHFPQKKWVIDAGALQMVAPELLPSTSIITPHHGEWERLVNRVLHDEELAGFSRSDEKAEADEYVRTKLLRQGVCLVLKGKVDTIFYRDHQVEVAGGNPGMTKGGTGDVLAGIISALYTTHSAETAAVVGSVTNKQAGELLYQQVGPYFNTSDLVQAVPQALWGLVKRD